MRLTSHPLQHVLIADGGCLAVDLEDANAAAKELQVYVNSLRRLIGRKELGTGETVRTPKPRTPRIKPAPTIPAVPTLVTPTLELEAGAQYLFRAGIDFMAGDRDAFAEKIVLDAAAKGLVVHLSYEEDDLQVVVGKVVEEMA